jgi:hypothetical protein
MWHVQIAFLLLYVRYPFRPWLYVILHVSRNRPNWSSPSFSSTTFQNFTGISDLLSEVSKFNQQTNLCSNCNSSLTSSLNLGRICRRKEPFQYLRCFCHDNPRFNFTHTSCVICYKATEINCHWMGWCSGKMHSRSAWFEYRINRRSSIIAVLFLRRKRKMSE